MKGKLAIGATLFFALLLVALAHSVVVLRGHEITPSSVSHAPLLRVRPSYLLRHINRELGRHPSVPISQFIAEANSEIVRQGFDYEFEVSQFISKRRLTPLVPLNRNEFGTEPYELALMTVQGARLRLEMDVELMEGPCGERSTLLPAARVTSGEIELVVDSRHYHVKRPSGFGLDRMQLVDEKTKRTLRTWELPFEAEALGVSPDGRTLFLLPNFNIYASNQDTSLTPIAASMPMLAGLQAPSRAPRLILAVSDTGVQFAFEDELIEREKSELLEDRDPNLPYAGYKRFHVGNKSYVVRFEWPCT